MKKLITMSFAALALSSAYAITATKVYVDNATNATLTAAKAYTDQHTGGQSVTYQIATNIANYRISQEVAPWAMQGQPQPTTDLRSATNYTDTVAASMPLNAAMTNGVIDLAALVATNRIEYVWDLSPSIPSEWKANGDPYYSSEEGFWIMTFSNPDERDNSVYFAYDDAESSVLHFEFMYGIPTGVKNFTATRRRNPIPSLDLVATNDLASAIRDATNDLAPKAMISAANHTFSDAVVQVVDVKFDAAVTNALTNAVVATVYSIDGTNIVKSVVTNTVAVAMNDLLGDGWRTKYGGGLAGALAAILAALALLQKKKISTLKCGSITVGNGATAGETDVSLLFTSNNTSLNTAIDNEIAARCNGLDPNKSTIKDVINALKGND